MGCTGGIGTRHDSGPRRAPQLCGPARAGDFLRRRHRFDQRQACPALPLYDRRRAGVVRRDAGTGLDRRQEAGSGFRRAPCRCRTVQQDADGSRQSGVGLGHRSDQPHLQYRRRLLAGPDLPICGPDHRCGEWRGVAGIPGSGWARPVPRAAPQIAVHPIEYCRHDRRDHRVRFASDPQAWNVARRASGADLARHRLVLAIGSDDHDDPGAGEEPTWRACVARQARRDRSPQGQFSGCFRAALVRQVLDRPDALSVDRARNPVLLRACRIVPR